MSNEMSIDLTDDQRKVLLKGLRYVRSSLMLEMNDPTPESERKRDDQLREIAALAGRLSGDVVVQEPAEIS